MTNPSALYLPGTSGEYVSTPDSADFNLTSFEMVVKVSIPNWNTGVDYIVGKGGHFGFRTGANTLILYTRTISGDFAAESATHGLSTDTWYWLRTTYNSIAGTVSFYYAADQSAEPSTWTSISLDVSTGGTGLNDFSSDFLAIGGLGNSLHKTMTISRFILRDAVSSGSLVADFRADAPIEPRYRDSTGKIWTLNGSAYSFVEVS